MKIKEKLKGLLNKKTYGFILIFAVVVAMGIYSYVITTENLELSARNTELEEKRDCSLHLQQIENYKAQIEEKNEKISALSSTDEKVVEDTEYFLKQYFTNNNTSSQELFDRIKPLITSDMYNLLMPEDGLTNEDMYNGQYYEVGIEKMQTFGKRNGTTAEVVSILHIYSKTDPKQEISSEPVLFKAKLSYNADTDKWLISEFEEISYIRYISTLEY